MFRFNGLKLQVMMITGHVKLIESLELLTVTRLMLSMKFRLISAQKQFTSEKPSIQSDSGGYWVRRMRQLPRDPSKIVHTVSFCCRCFLEIIIKLGQKVGDTRSIRGEDLFFREHLDFGRKK